jgi:hypothetical protein
MGRRASPPPKSKIQTFLANLPGPWGCLSTQNSYVPCSAWTAHRLLRLCSVASKSLLHTGEPVRRWTRRPLTTQLSTTGEAIDGARMRESIDAEEETKMAKACDSFSGRWIFRNQAPVFAVQSRAKLGQSLPDRISVASVPDIRQHSVDGGKTGFRFGQDPLRGGPMGHPAFRFCDIGKCEAKLQIGSKKIDAALIGCGLEVGQLRQVGHGPFPRVGAGRKTPLPLIAARNRDLLAG